MWHFPRVPLCLQILFSLWIVLPLRNIENRKMSNFAGNIKQIVICPSK